MHLGQVLLLLLGAVLVVIRLVIALVLSYRIQIDIVAIVQVDLHDLLDLLDIEDALHVGSGFLRQVQIEVRLGKPRFECRFLLVTRKVTQRCVDARGLCRDAQGAS